MVDVITAAADLAAAKAALAAAEAEVASATPAPVAATAPVAASPGPAPASEVAPAAVAPAADPAPAPAAPVVVFNADGTVVGAPVALPVVHQGDWRVPDINDVVVNGVIVGRHSEARVRAEILAKAKEWFSKVRSL